ncbi:hypothetical protein ITP53_52910 [Nonomuraea sp. K274]|uniref:Uncharacterized protein n=1 Tax=Nonomuraea cypriaca TaxID=1187855 RepID=A0A931ANI1_9ACTN|nr:hypothetical protein [Nonomuraea cypriaca]MBF8194229.1 hypothetical protein [Nonomuraea cypriaca]
MTIDWSDPAWVAIVVAVVAGIVSVGALLVSWRGLKWQKKAALAADRSANEAEKATSILALEAEHRTSSTASAASVTWTLERSKDRYTLRNTGAGVATGVKVDGRGVAEVGIQVPHDAAVRPGGSVSFMMAGSMAHAVPDEIEVTWDGHPDPVVVPVPRRR